MLKTLREPRYAAFGALMIVVALGCIAAGTWQIYRFEQKRQENHALRRNDHAATTSVGDVLPLTGTGRTPRHYDVALRTVRISGRYDPTLATLVRKRTVDDVTGFLVLTPLRTSTAPVLVVRGFLPQPASGAIPRPPAAPVGQVTVTARVQPPESSSDGAGELADRQVESINPREQAGRLGGPVYNGYVVLHAGQPGTAHMRALPAPSLGNPAGGALEPQHFAYIIQWYLFAALALAAPVVMARAETRQRPTGEIDTDLPAAAKESPLTSAAESAAPSAAPSVAEPPPWSPPDAEQARAAKLADRYGRPVRR